MSVVKFEEFTYISSNANHEWKRKDVALLLLGIFIEDIQMFCIRNPKYNLNRFIEEIIKVQVPVESHMQKMIKGRMLWCASACSECLIANDDQNLKVRSQIIDISIETLKMEKDISIKLISTRTLVKFARKMKKEHLHENA